MSSIRHRPHTGQCKRNGGCYNELMVAIFRTGAGVKGKVDFIISSPELKAQGELIVWDSSRLLSVRPSVL